MDSRFAADPIARDILNKLALLERTAGVRAHYRILEPLPLSSTDISALQTAARMIGDWIGLRNAMFHISITEAVRTPTSGGMRVENEQEEFSVEIPKESIATPTLAMAALAQEVAHAYLIKGNITAGLQAEGPASGRAFLDITAIFLGLGKLLLNGCVAAEPPAGTRSGAQSTGPCNLPPSYLAFTYRATCSMRGLDYQQHLVGLLPAAVDMLHQWNTHKDSVFSLSLRNVLTASQPHRPLLDAVSDNHVALARFDQLLRYSETYFLGRMRHELAQYHLECQEAVTRLSTREQDTYDPCMVYLNHLRRRMDLQRFADALQQQQDQVLERLQILLRGIHSLEDHDLLRLDDSAPAFLPPICPLDGTPVALPEGQREARVTCPTCAYEFLASSDAPLFANAQPRTAGQGAGSTAASEPEVPKSRQKPAREKTVLKDQRVAGSRTSTPAGALMLIWGISLLPLSWLPLLGYVLVGLYRGTPVPYAELLGRVGLVGSSVAMALIILGSLALAIRHFRRKSTPVEPATVAVGQSPQPEG